MTGERLRPLHWSEVDALPRREFLIDGLLDLGAMSGIIGASGAYKTGHAIDFGGHIALGQPWRGREVRRGSALYLAVEGGRGISERLAAWRKHHNGAGARADWAAASQSGALARPLGQTTTEAPKIDARPPRGHALRGRAGFSSAIA